MGQISYSLHRVTPEHRTSLVKDYEARASKFLGDSNYSDLLVVIVPEVRDLKVGFAIQDNNAATLITVGSPEDMEAKGGDKQLAFNVQKVVADLIKNRGMTVTVPLSLETRFKLERLEQRDIARISLPQNKALYVSSGNDCYEVRRHFDGLAYARCAEAAKAYFGCSSVAKNRLYTLTAPTFKGLHMDFAAERGSSNSLALVGAHIPEGLSQKDKSALPVIVAHMLKVRQATLEVAQAMADTVGLSGQPTPRLAVGHTPNGAISFAFNDLSEQISA